MPSTIILDFSIPVLLLGRFMSRCREASSEDEKAQHYINILISSAEYDTFVKLMRIMRPVAEAKLQESQSHRADSKHGAESERKSSHKGEADEESDAKAEGEGKDEDEK